MSVGKKPNYLRRTEMKDDPKVEIIVYSFIGICMLLVVLLVFYNFGPKTRTQFQNIYRNERWIIKEYDTSELPLSQLMIIYDVQTKKSFLYVRDNSATGVGLEYLDIEEFKKEEK